MIDVQQEPAASPDSKQYFTYEEALASFPSARRITEIAVRQIEGLVSRIRSRDELDVRRDELEEAYKHIVEAWADEIMGLGCDVKGLWLVDWDSGCGYYCWQYPEATIGHFHGYEEGFGGRLPVA
jgi:hypothetical protein